MSSTQDEVTRGAKVLLRLKRVEDAPDDHRWRQDPELAALDAAEVLRQPLEQFTHDLEQELRYLTPWVRRFAIDTLDGLHIGNCMLYDIDTVNGQAELGILVGNRDYWNGGYGREAVELLVAECFTQRTMRRIYLHTLSWNAFAGCGFREVGPDPRGKHDFILMEMTRAEWEARQP
jgi:RimJ/RimL family protein N-acetyltransferase